MSVMGSSCPKSSFGSKFLDIDFQGLCPNLHEWSETTVFEARLTEVSSGPLAVEDRRRSLTRESRESMPGCFLRNEDSNRVEFFAERIVHDG